MNFFKRILPKQLLLPENRHWFMLVYWILFGIIFWSMEAMTGRTYHLVEVGLDRVIPFCEWFVFAYFFWHIYIIGAMVYFLFTDKKVFVQYMWFVILTYSVTLLVYAVYPTMQTLRPQTLDGDGMLLDIVRWLYGFDTNTNVCPSLHIIGSFSVCFAAFNCERFRHWAIRTAFAFVTTIICLSTAFLKQHSVLDIFWGAVVSAVAYPLVFMENKVSNTLIGLFLSTHKKCGVNYEG